MENYTTPPRAPLQLLAPNLTEAAPAPRVYLMRGTKTDNWRHIVLVAREDTRESVPDDQLTNKHASHAFCTKCQKKITYSSGQTGNVTRHASKCNSKAIVKVKIKKAKRKRHSGLFMELLGAEDIRTDDLREMSAQEKQQLKTHIAWWLAESLRPYNLVHDRGFRRLLRFIAAGLGNVNVVVPSRGTIVKEVCRLAKRMREQIKAMIAQGCEYYSLTTDAWTDRAMRSYLALTLHYIDKGFVMHDMVLEVTPFPGKHTGTVIKNKLEKALGFWGLDSKNCVKMLRDGATNEILGADLLGVSHMHCLAHSLHLVLGAALVRKKGKLSHQSVMEALEAEAGAAEITAALGPPVDVSQIAEELEADPGAMDTNMDEVWNTIRDAACDEVDMHAASTSNTDQKALQFMHETVQKFRSVAVYVRKSAKAKHWLVVEQEKTAPSSQYISLDCPTRWNSTRDMLASFVALKTVVVRFFGYLESREGRAEFGKVSIPRPTLQDWFAINCLLQMLHPFGTITKALGHKGFSSLAFALPYLRHIERELERTDIFSEERIKVTGYLDELSINAVLNEMEGVRLALLRLFSDRFKTFDLDILWTSYLDPRLTEMATLTAEEAVRARGLLIAAAVAMLSKNKGRLNVPPPPPPPLLDTPAKAKTRSDRTVFGRRALQREETQRPTVLANSDYERCCAEVSQYIEVTANVPIDANPLNWWAIHGHEFPTLALLARKWLGCVATFIPCEQAFSISGRVVTTARCSLKPETCASHAIATCPIPSKDVLILHGFQVVFMCAVG